MRNLKREAACEYCNSAESLYYAEDHGMKAEISIYAHTSTLCIDLYDDYVDLQINFCPMCGRKLDEES